MEIQLPFSVEYSKTGRASCKLCKTAIPKEALRIAVMVQSAFHDGKQPNWYHKDCFFVKQRPSSVGDIANFENLRFADQQELEKLVASVGSVVDVGSSKGKKRSKVESQALKDFSIEYAKSGRAACRGCEQKILKDQVRIRKTVYDTEVGMKYGGQALWHHIECFAQLRSELGWLDTGENLPGFKSLSKEDREEVKKSIPPMKAEDQPASKKPKLEKLEENEKELDAKQLELLKKQTEKLFKLRDHIKEEMVKDDMINYLLSNNQDPISGDSEKLLDQIADLAAFGALEPCHECKGRQLLFNKSGYLCNGNLSEWTKCSTLTKEPKRTPCKVPSYYKEKYPFLYKLVPKKPSTRVIRYVPPSASTIAKSIPVKKKDDEVDGPKVKRERPPLYQFKFAHIGLKDSEKELKDRIMKLGGILQTKITDETIAVISNEKELKKNSKSMTKAKDLEIHVVPIEYLDAVENDSAGAINLITSMTLCDWGTDPSSRLPQEQEKSGKSKSIYTKSVAKSQTLKVNNGLAVDPGSGLEDVAHVYVKGEDKYNAVLGLTDIQRNKNSFYKLQLLESTAKNRYWVFRSWGRIGTTIGGDKLEHHPNLFNAITSFKAVYFDKTGNEFDNRENFVKVANRMYPIDVDYEDKKEENLSKDNTIESKLDPSVQSLIQLIFDVDNMKRTMMEFHLDMEKMPLGKLSLKQIQSAYKVLSVIYDLIQQGGTNAKFIDATNQFYTLIPHSFGVDSPPLLDTLEQVENLRQMLDSLAEIECAYSLIKNEVAGEDVNPLDKHYETLKTKLAPLDKQSEEFELLQKYVVNSHAKTHCSYDLEIIDIFKVARQGEARRFKPFKKLHNRKLLWHGSRLTNFAGILSHGLKIAPKEAPVTGYMFGKGIYFADMVSKSANYCCTSQQNSTGLLLLSEVALGNMLECTSSNYVTKLPKDKHSCFGRGKTMPDPKESYVREDGVEIPIGKPLCDDNLRSSLLYNEYIVYDIAQANIQYLLRMEFKYKY